MADSHVSSISLAIILLINTKYISSDKCDSFKDVAVDITDINNYKFHEIVNGCIQEMEFDNKTVKRVNVEDQKVPVLGEDSVRNMDHLVSIHFLACELEVVEPFAFRNVPKLEHVWITFCNLIEIPKDVFNVIPNMKSLAFYNNKIDYIENKAFANLTSLKEVLGFHNNLDYWNREWFEDSINLEKINFIHNKIRMIPRKAFAALGKLKEIHFNYNEISTIQPDAFKGLRNLEYLGLRGNKLTVLNEDIFPNGIHVRLLFIGVNYLNFLSTEVLKKISVKTMELHYNPWKCPCLDRINYWLFSTNGTLLDKTYCKRNLIPVCAYPNSYSQTCLEYVDNELTHSYFETLRGIDDPLLKHCARLD